MAETLVRCAIYTRKSTEEGLTQEFNSLHAQREAAETYIASQRAAGWVALANAYDDGGFTGANLERPALARLLADIERGEIDCVVVYKVDRLSRSLLDFARLVELFDRRGLSFVSITQDFNTRTSLGRLTLNILLSFAQFEREIISERTRDKLSAARRKGKWIGGYPVLGYDVAPGGGHLIVNAGEAEQVRLLFQIAEATGSLAETAREAHRQRITTKEWSSRSGKHHEAKPITTDGLRRLLTNVLYIGFVLHKGVRYVGQQEAIVSQHLWDAAQRAVAPARSRSRHSRQPAPLAGLIECAICGRPMMSTYTMKKGRQHRYYACGPSRSSGSKGRHRVASEQVEELIAAQIDAPGGAAMSGAFVSSAVERITCNAESRLTKIALRNGLKLEYFLASPRFARKHGKNTSHDVRGRLPRITRLMALAIELQKDLDSGEIRNRSLLADVGQISRARMTQILQLTELAPAIQEELLYLPVVRRGYDAITERGLRRILKTVDWEAQIGLFRAMISDNM